MSILVAQTNGSEGILTSRPTIKPNLQNCSVVYANVNMATWTGAVNGDVYKSNDMYIEEPGLYTITTQNLTYVNTCKMDYTLQIMRTGSGIAVSPIVVGTVDLYTAPLVVSYFVFSSIKIPERCILKLVCTANGKNAASAGYNMFIGDIKIYKQ
jgi:hypothetical protein